MNRKELASIIDHTILKPEASYDEVADVVADAMNYGCASVCINGRWVDVAKNILRHNKTGATKICAVVGFPFGAGSTASKVAEAETCVRMGAEEIDMVVSISDLLSHNMKCVEQDIRSVVMAAEDADGSAEIIVKVILETGLLSEEAVRLGCEAAAVAGAKFVKTSTGFHQRAGGATVETVNWLAKYGKPLGLKVKASGGIKDLTTALAMINAGADRLGCSSSVTIISALSE